MSRRYLKVEGNPNLVRDMESGAIININKNEIQQARARKELLKNDKKRIENLENELIEVKNDLGDIKSLLEQLLEKR